MKKIPTIFKRDMPNNPGIVLPELVVDDLWLAEAIPTRKYDGSCCLVTATIFYRRRELKRYAKKPEGWILADTDDGTEKMVGWVPVSISDPADRWHRDAFSQLLVDAQNAGMAWPAGGTYELLGPKVQGNREAFAKHTLLPHAEAEILRDVPLEFDALKSWLAPRDIEGVVWHHPDGGMAKVKKRDFGLKRDLS